MPSEKTPSYHPVHLRIADLADADKPREKALELGIRSLTDAELLAILIGMGVPGKSVLELSREILAAASNSLPELASWSIRDLARRFHGLGTAKAVTIAAALELGGRRSDAGQQKETVIRSSADVYGLMRRKIEDCNTEEFWIVALNQRNKVISCERISMGGVASTLVDVKVVARTAIEHLASAIILVHNHPSGNMKPSAQDDSLTRKIKEGVALLDIRVTDHIIIGPTSYYSYADQGRL